MARSMSILSAPKPKPLPPKPDLELGEAQAKTAARQRLRRGRQASIFTSAQGISEEQKKTTFGGL